MGDRANIVLHYEVDGYSDIYLYTHHGGHELPLWLKKALIVGQEHWDDPSYLARIIFQVMITGDDGLTGFGISPYQGDNEHELIHVFLSQKMVSIGEYDFSYDEYIELEEGEINKFYLGRDYCGC